MTRIWDKYLSQADHEHIGNSTRNRIGFGQKPALLLIDLYRAVFGDKPEPLMQAIKIWPSSCGMAGWDALPHIRRLLEAARQTGIPVVHVSMLTDAGMPGWSEAARRDSKTKLPDRQDAAALDRKRRAADIIDEVAPIAGEVVLRKTAPSAFWGTPLAGQLTYLGVDTLIIAGESTSGCVRATVVDAVSHRYRVQVVEECVFDRHEAPHAINLFDMHQKYADVIALDETLQWLGDRVSRQAREPALT